MTKAPLHAQVDDLVMVMDEALRREASGIAQALRRADRRVDLVLEAKKMKWVFKVRLPCFRCPSHALRAACMPQARRPAFNGEHVLQSLAWVLRETSCCAAGAQHAERCGAQRLLIVAPDEWAQGLVRVKDLGSREEQNVTLQQLLETPLPSAQ